ncbi:MAG: hypothetical protein HY855_25125 [Burkholderiales bacterium]|nr:hypothetical protein [Burkholderiales bacterium]
MNDRELLEAAARAAGIVIDKSPFNGGGRENTGFDVMGNAVLDWHNGTKWNPLTDDGDALRLAVKLNLDIEFDTLPDGPIVGVVAPWNDNFGDYRWYEWLLKDALSATRRAIVRAAAEVGKTPNVGGNRLAPTQEQR